MLRTLSLLLPALIPSWRFFKTVAPSPRLWWRLEGGDWAPVRPRPERVAFATMLRRLVWNPDWNEDLYLVTLSERLVETGSAHSLHELNTRIARITGAPPGARLQFRLTFVTRSGATILTEELYRSDPVEVPG
ncbi:hypothetical protein [Tropicibacter alexandrii]|uniref:hypothetical protein n=1 Tax=Tropicibacter alexandrii TaxID=2267683 RepID=UPI000EF51C1B|nr:hypothetical protein [Tropicibacter alexandrii]